MLLASCNEVGGLTAPSRPVASFGVLFGGHQLAALARVVSPMSCEWRPKPNSRYGTRFSEGSEPPTAHVGPFPTSRLPAKNFRSFDKRLPPRLPAKKPSRLRAFLFKNVRSDDWVRVVDKWGSRVWTNPGRDGGEARRAKLPSVRPRAAPDSPPARMPTKSFKNNDLHGYPQCPQALLRPLDLFKFKDLSLIGPGDVDVALGPALNERHSPPIQPWRRRPRTTTR